MVVGQFFIDDIHIHASNYRSYQSTISLGLPCHPFPFGEELIGEYNEDELTAGTIRYL